ncbi:MAG: DNA integrity scanning diadenylate cyclase DisA [Acidimicrobiia bacterium]|nr:DNA integrity scanning diadenylate cyclase DisA [Acidimicrobiia bacterium]
MTSDSLSDVGGPSITETLERLAPGTPMRDALERVIQQGKGGLVVLGSSKSVMSASSGGFKLNGTSFTPARLAELAKMDGGIILDDSWGSILRCNVHFVPDGSIPTDETGARHRTAERMAIETGKPVVAVSEGRKVATLFYKDQKIELRSPTDVVAHINQELQSLDRLRSRLDEAESVLTGLELAGLSTYRAAVTVIQRAELVDRLGLTVMAQARTLGDEASIVTLQLSDILSGVEDLRSHVLTDYVKPLRKGSVDRALQRLAELSSPEIEDPARVGKELGFPDLDEPAEARGHRILSKVARLPDPVREEIVRHFGSVTKLLKASEPQLTDVEGVGDARASQLRSFLDRLAASAPDWGPLLD